MGTQVIDVPNVGPVEFPEGMSDADIVSAIKKNSMAKYTEAVTKNGWGTGVAPFAEKTGAAVNDFLAKYLPAPLAAGAGAATNAAIQVGPSLLTSVRGIPALTDAEVSHNALVGQKDSVLQAGKDLGLKVPPSQVNPSFTNRVIESVGGKAATAQQASAANQDIAYSVAQREAGLQPAEAINTDNLKAARDRMAQPYRDIGALPATGPLSQPPFGSPAKTLQDLQDARSEAKQLWNYYNRSAIPSVLREAKSASAKADNLESALEAQATAAGRPELAQALREARMGLAKNFTVERAMRGSSFDPAALSRLESRANVPLSGDLEKLMQMQRDFPKAMAAPQIGGSIGVNQLLPLLGGSAGGAGGAALGAMHGVPGMGGALGGAAGLILGQTIPPAARSLMLSGPYQSLMANLKPISDSTNPLLPFLANPALMQTLPQSTGALFQRN